MAGSKDGSEYIMTKEEFVENSSLKFMCSEETMLAYMRSSHLANMLEDIPNMSVSLNVILESEMDAATKEKLGKLALDLWDASEIDVSVERALYGTDSDAILAPIVCFATFIEVIGGGDKTLKNEVPYVMLLQLGRKIDASLNASVTDYPAFEVERFKLDDSNLPTLLTVAALSACAMHLVVRALGFDLDREQKQQLPHFMRDFPDLFAVVDVCLVKCRVSNNVGVARFRALWEISMMAIPDLLNLFCLAEKSLGAGDSGVASILSFAPALLSVLPLFGIDQRGDMPGMAPDADWAATFYRRTLLYCLSSEGLSYLMHILQRDEVQKAVYGDLSSIMSDTVVLTGMVACVALIREWRAEGFVQNELLAKAAEDIKLTDDLVTGKTVAIIFVTLSQMTADGRLTADDFLKAGITREILHSGVRVAIPHITSLLEPNQEEIPRYPTLKVLEAKGKLLCYAISMLGWLTHGRGVKAAKMIKELLECDAFEALCCLLECLTDEEMLGVIYSRDNEALGAVDWVPDVLCAMFLLLSQMCVKSEERSNVAITYAGRVLQLINRLEVHYNLSGGVTRQKEYKVIRAALGFLSNAVDAGYEFCGLDSQEVMVRGGILVHEMKMKEIDMHRLITYITRYQPTSQWFVDDSKVAITPTQLHTSACFMIALLWADIVHPDDRSKASVRDKLMNIVRLDLLVAQKALRENLTGNLPLAETYQVLSPITLLLNVVASTLVSTDINMYPYTAQIILQILDIVVQICLDWMPNQKGSKLESAEEAVADSASVLDKLLPSYLRTALQYMKDAIIAQGIAATVQIIEIMPKLKKLIRRLMDAQIRFQQTRADLSSSHEHLWNYLLDDFLMDVSVVTDLADQMDKLRKQKEASRMAKAQAAADAAMAALLAEEENSQQAQQDDNEKKKAKRQRQKEKQRALKEAAEAEQRAKQEAEVAKAEAARKTEVERNAAAACEQETVHSAAIDTRRSMPESSTGPQNASSKKKKNKKKGSEEKSAYDSAVSTEFGIDISPLQPQLNVSAQPEVVAMAPVPVDPGLIDHLLPPAVPAVPDLEEDDENLRELLGLLLPGMMDQELAIHLEKPIESSHPSSTAEQLVPMLDVGELSGPIGDCLKDPQRWEELQMVLQCPVSGIAFQDPVILMDGCSYERNAVGQFGEAVAASVRPNHALRALMQELREQGCAI